MSSGRVRADRSCWRSRCSTATVALVSAARAPCSTGSLGGRQVFPRTQLVEPRHQPGAARSRLGRLHQLHQRPHRRRTPTATRRLHPDFGPSPYGIPYVVVSGDQPLVRPTWTAYGDESDEGAPGRPLGYPIPDEAKTQADYIEGAVAGGGLDGDRHLLIVDRDNWLLYETGATRWNAAANRWEANCGAIFDLNTQRSPPRDVDVGRRRGSRDLSRARALRRGVRHRGDHARLPRHRARRPTATSGRRRIAPDRPAARCRWARACG